MKNAVALFHVLEKEKKWRRERGQAEGFTTIEAKKPIIAVGASHPLEEEILMADYFHGRDGLGGVHDSHPHLSPDDAWQSLFNRSPPGSTKTEIAANQELAEPTNAFNASKIPSHLEMLRLLRENEPNTITIVAVGPLTNLALAASEDPETFLRVKEVVVMGGALEIMGNVTPVAEFNTYADAIATARVFALTSPMPSSTMPPVAPCPTGRIEPLPAYPAKLSKPLNLTLFPLDITELHHLKKSTFDAKIAPLVAAGSPLAEWVSVFMGKTYEKINNMTNGYMDPGLSLHDPLTIWYMLTRTAPEWKLSAKSPEDIRVETAGQWTRGMHVIDRRNRRRKGGKGPNGEVLDLDMQGDDGEGNLEGDDDGWLTEWKGNRINRMAVSPGENAFAPYILERIFG